MSTAPIAQGPVDVTVGLLIEAADELAWLHREYLSRSPLSEGVPRITRLLQKIESHTGHVTASPYLPPNPNPPTENVGQYLSRNPNHER